MAAFTAAQLRDLAKTRYGASTLQQRMGNGALDSNSADSALLAIANGVFGRVIAACKPNIGWPLPGVWPTGAGKDDDGTTDLDGKPYTDVWPKDLLERAIELFNWRTVSGLDSASDTHRATGKSAEKYFDDLEAGKLSLGIGGDTDVAAAFPISARNRDGSSNVNDVPDTENILDIFDGTAWNG